MVRERDRLGTLNAWTDGNIFGYYITLTPSIFNVCPRSPITDFRKDYSVFLPENLINSRIPSRIQRVLTMIIPSFLGKRYKPQGAN